MKHLLVYLFGSALVLVGTAGPLPGCASMGISAEDAVTVLSVADIAVRTAKEESERVKAARARCKDLETKACDVTSKEDAADVLRALAEAQRELADALSEEPAPAPSTTSTTSSTPSH
ncbi:MAG: hypothetical protein U0441_14955 [Polyangiaceae bacterium]